jgi:hypothetical protein
LLAERQLPLAELLLPASNVFISSISLTAVTPAHAAMGLVNVVVTNLILKVATGTGLLYTYQAALYRHLTYSRRRTIIWSGAGTAVTITGTGFVGERQLPLAELLLPVASSSPAFHFTAVTC